MLTLTTRTNKGKETIYAPESWHEVSVDQFQRLVKEWDNEDWVQLFSILTGKEYSGIQTSTDSKLETTLYQTVSFALDPNFDWKNLTRPKVLELRPIWAKDVPLPIDRIEIPHSIGRMSIGQNIQARKSLEDMKDLREGISIVTAIYLQPLLDKGPFDMLRVTHYEYIISKMPITKIYPIGFFLLRRLMKDGNRFTRILSLWKRNLINAGRRSLRWFLGRRP